MGVPLRSTYFIFDDEVSTRLAEFKVLQKALPAFGGCLARRMGGWEGVGGWRAGGWGGRTGDDFEGFVCRLGQGVDKERNLVILFFLSFHFMLCDLVNFLHRCDRKPGSQTLYKEYTLKVCFDTQKYDLLPAYGCFAPTVT